MTKVRPSGTPFSGLDSECRTVESKEGSRENAAIVRTTLSASLPSGEKRQTGDQENRPLVAERAPGEFESSGSHELIARRPPQTPAAARGARSAVHRRSDRRPGSGPRSAAPSPEGIPAEGSPRAP